MRFNNLSEVRQLSDALAEDAKLARLSWSAYMRAEEAKLKQASRLTVKQVIKTAVVFCFIVSTHVCVIVNQLECFKMVLKYM